MPKSGVNANILNGGTLIIGAQQQYLNGAANDQLDKIKHHEEIENDR